MIREFLDGNLLPTPFLDISTEVHAEFEPGLLSMVFAPDYAASGRFYVYYNDRVGNKNVNVVEFRRSAVNPETADLGTRRQILYIVKPWENHNGGMMQFGPDGYLYISVGDGDSGILNPPGAFAQTLGDLLGDMLRIDPLHPTFSAPYSIPAGNPFVNHPGALPEIWSYGLRNPWRFWIDPPTGDLYIGDVALGGPEEIDYVKAGTGGGQNFGWPCFEGNAPYDATATCLDPTPSLLSVPHNGTCAIIGGVVAHDPRLPTLDGRYLYSDYCSGQIRSLLVVAGSATDDKAVGAGVGQPSAFGVDGQGRVYLGSSEGSALFRLDPAPAS